MMMLLLKLLALVGTVMSGSQAPSPKGDETPSESTTGPIEPPRMPEVPDQVPVQTHHQLTTGVKELNYQVTTGMMPLTNEVGEIEARIFFIAYTLNGPGGSRNRPLMFSFNGGPGSSSVWLHLGALGPRRVRMEDEGWMPAPPFMLVDNEHTWLESTDLVFIDPVGTGYSRATTPELEKKFHSVKGDIEAVGEFIRLYLTRYRRWSSPLFLVGESYGTFRAAGLAGRLIEKGIAFNGIILVSSILNLQTARFVQGNDLPYILFLPTYTAAAWYHRKLNATLLEQGLVPILQEVEQWATSEYLIALARGDALTEQDRYRIVQRLAAYTGLDPSFIDQSNLRIDIQRFCKELLRGEKCTVGRLDSRYTGVDALAVSERPDHDPSLSAIRPPFTAMLNDYVRTELGYETDTEYNILDRLEWDWGNAEAGHPDASEALRAAFAKNPYLRMFVASGHYDLATPYFATEYTINHMNLAPLLRANIQTERYDVGHMVYLEQTALARLKRDVAGFIQEALPGSSK